LVARIPIQRRDQPIDALLIQLHIVIQQHSHRIVQVGQHPVVRAQAQIRLPDDLHVRVLRRQEAQRVVGRGIVDDDNAAIVTRGGGCLDERRQTVGQQAATVEVQHQ
jgi:hypothetical protein